VKKGAPQSIPAVSHGDTADPRPNPAELLVAEFGSDHGTPERLEPQRLQGKQVAIVAAPTAAGSFAPYRDALRTTLASHGAEVARYDISSDETIRSVLRQRPEITFIDDAAETSRFANTVRALWPQAVFVVLTTERTPNSSTLAKGRASSLGVSSLGVSTGTSSSPISYGSAPGTPTLPIPRLCIHDAVPNVETLTHLLRLENNKRPQIRDSEDTPQELSVREVEILRGVVHGFSLDEIASRIFVAPKTLNNQLTTIYRKLRVSGLTQAVVSALRLGLIDLNER
jgi:DNA-binding CsgD family transcriptional regulator